DAEALAEQFVERLVLEVAGAEPGDERGGDVEFFECDRFVICQSQTQDRDDFGVLAEVKPPSDVRSGRGGLEAEDMRAGAHSAGDHVLGEGTRGQGVIEPRTEREVSGAMAAADETFTDEFVDGPSRGHPRY